MEKIGSIRHLSIVIILIEFVWNSLAAQVNYLDSINHYLFEEIDNTPVNIEFIYKDSTYKIRARYLDAPKKFSIVKHITIPKNELREAFAIENPDRGDIISYFCEKLRESHDTSLIPRLKETLFKHEKYFLEEWEPAWRSSQYLRMYDIQYDILYNLDITLTYLLIYNYKEDHKYEFIKNLYQLQWGDRNIERLKKSLFHSDYVLNFMKGKCYSSNFCICNLMDQMADEIGNMGLIEIQKLNFLELPKSDLLFYYNFLDVLKYYNSDSVEYIISNNIVKFNYLNEKNLIKCYYPIEIYNLFSFRNKISGLNFLLENAIESKPKENNDPWYLKKIAEAGILGESLVRNELKIRLLRQDSLFQHYLNLAKYTLYNDSKVKLINELKNNNKKVARKVIEFFEKKDLSNTK